MVIRKKKGCLKGHLRAKVPVRKGKTVILPSRQQFTGLHRSFRAAGPTLADGVVGQLIRCTNNGRYPCT